MRKQTDFAYRQIEYSAIEANKSTAVWSQWVKDNYLSQGWEILSTHVVSSAANSTFLGISFVKYEDVEEVKTKRATN